MSEGPRIPILVVEDEAAIRSGLCDVLAFHGYEPTGVERGDDGLAAGLDGDHALVLLDLMLPGMSGFDVCEKLRESQPSLPILMLTARGSEEDVLRGFRCGADDYVTKPFSIAELLARVEALLRRSGQLERPDEPTEPFAFGPWTVDPSALVARRGDDEEDEEDKQQCELTRREIDVLVALAAQTGRIVSRRSLLADVWGYPDPDRVETRTIDMHVAKLRKKLDGPSRSLIETVRGEGYRYTG
jgi:two-component system response regulator RegX3